MRLFLRLLLLSAILFTFAKVLIAGELIKVSDWRYGDWVDQFDANQSSSDREAAAPAFSYMLKTGVDYWLCFSLRCEGRVRWVPGQTSVVVITDTGDTLMSTTWMFATHPPDQQGWISEGENLPFGLEKLIGPAVIPNPTFKRTKKGDTMVFVRFKERVDSKPKSVTIKGVIE